MSAKTDLETWFDLIQNPNIKLSDLESHFQKIQHQDLKRPCFIDKHQSVVIGPAAFHIAHQCLEAPFWVAGFISCHTKWFLSLITECQKAQCSFQDHYLYDFFTHSKKLESFSLDDSYFGFKEISKLLSLGVKLDFHTTTTLFEAIFKPSFLRNKDKAEELVGSIMENWKLTSSMRFYISDCLIGAFLNSEGFEFNQDSLTELFEINDEQDESFLEDKNFIPVGDNPKFLEKLNFFESLLSCVSIIEKSFFSETSTVPPSRWLEVLIQYSELPDVFIFNLVKQGLDLTAPISSLNGQNYLQMVAEKYPLFYPKLEQLFLETQIPTEKSEPKSVLRL